LWETGHLLLLWLAAAKVACLGVITLASLLLWYMGGIAREEGGILKSQESGRAEQIACVVG
jgi:hypothetical protein